MLFALQAGGPQTRDLLATAADLSLVLLGVFAIIGSILGIVLLLRLNRAGRELHGIARALRGKADPFLEHGKGVAANVEFITAALRTDVEQLNASVRSLSARLQQASDRMEERIEEFNALMEVVQGEAEGVFLDTAATVRGVQAGAGRLVRAAGRTDPEEDGARPDLEEGVHLPVQDAGDEAAVPAGAAEASGPTDAPGAAKSAD